MFVAILKYINMFIKPFAVWSYWKSGILLWCVSQIYEHKLYKMIDDLVRVHIRETVNNALSKTGAANTFIAVICGSII